MAVGVGKLARTSSKALVVMDFEDTKRPAPRYELEARRSAHVVSRMPGYMRQALFVMDF